MNLFGHFFFWDRNNDFFPLKERKIFVCEQNKYFYIEDDFCCLKQNTIFLFAEEWRKIALLFVIQQNVTN